MIPVKRMIPGKIAALLIIFLTKSCQAEEPIGLSDPKSENLKDYTSTISFKNVDLKSGKFCSNGAKNVGSIKISLLSSYKVTRVMFRDSKNDQRPFEIKIFGGDDNELELVKSHKFVSAAKNESIPVNTDMSDVMIEIKSADNLPLNCFYLELFISNEVVEPTVKTQNDCLKLGCEQSCEYRFLNAFYLKCKCNDGYQLDSNGKNCSDINECNLNKCDKKTTTCHNTIGSFYCSCLDDTMELDSKNKNLQCIDRDECKINNGGCQQQCVNLNNGFRCDCYSGFEKINGSCQDKNECQNPFQCNSETSECINTLGGFYCKCLPGYEASLRNGCQDIDECKKKISGCTHYCTNTKGSYLCSCNRGYYLHSDNHTCIDIDECSSGEANCDAKTTSCKNRPGTFDCSCKTGYTSYNKTSCTDINECQLANGSCQKGCVNTIGSYYCTCPSGLKLAKDKKMCDDVAECSEPKLNNCEQNCYETYGSFYCGCKKGFYLNSDQKSCQDENECIKNEGRGECEQECENTIGSFKCSCKKGWQLSSDGSTCQDFNECQHINNLCNAVTSNCLNTQGSYECQCKRGYFKDEITGECTGILCRPYPLLQNGKIYPEKCTQPNAMRYTDECKFECNPGYELNAKSASSASCNVDGTWSFNQGGYEPKCEGVRCSNISAVANGDIVPSTCLTNGASYGETCTLYCKGGYDHIGPHEAICEKDGKFSHLLQESKCIERKKLVCPHDINLVLPLGKKEMAIPLSIFEELEKFEGVVSDPQGVLNGTYMFKSRRSSYLITLVNKYKDSCNFYVTIEDREPPTVTNCPNDKVFVSIIGEQGIVNWPEPVFSDNVGVKKVINNLQNNAYLSQQVYFVFYEAIDDYGNQAACRFFVHVRAKHCSKNSIPGGEGASKSWFSSSASQATVLLQCPVGFIFSEIVAPTPVFFCNNGEWVNRQVPDCVKRTNPTNGSCALGEIQLVHPTTKQIMCGLCPKGTEAGNIPGTCQKCLVGFYQDVEGSLKCKRCPDGQLTSTNGQKSALSCEVPCGAGKYSLTGFDGVDGCKRCPSGSYQELEGQIACKICHQSATSENGSVTEDQCRLSARVSKIIPESELILASVGDNITLDCYGTGSPAPHLMFVKEKSLNNNETQSVMTMESLATGNRYITGLRVMIKNVKEADSGIYVCKADNRLTSTGAIDGRSIFVEVSKNINDVN